MNKEEFLTSLKELNIAFNDEMIEKLEKYRQELKDYNEHTNLTAIKDDEGIYLKHFYDSLTIVKVIDLNNVHNLLDIGTGAGFPGMVIKIFFPHLDVYLLDSNNKKTTFLKYLAEILDVKVNIINKRVEEYAKDNLNTFDVVTSRAVANLRVLSELALPLVKEEGYFIALKGNVEEELKEASDTIAILRGTIYKQETFYLYQNEGLRNILVIQKKKKTLKENLRPYDKIVKKPLKK